MIYILLDDKKIPYEHVYEHYSYVDQWARESCESYKGYEAMDVSDVSLECDVVAEYKFESAKDATLFSLKWK